MSTEREDESVIHEKPADQVDLEALATVIRTLQKLPSAASQRVLAAAAAFLDVSLPVAIGSTPARSADQIQGGRALVSSSFSEDRAPSPKEFLLEKQPQTDVDKVVCLAYYLTHYRNTPHFTPLELAKLNTEAAQPKFSNIEEASDSAIEAGLMLPQSRGTKQLSPLAEAYVQALPNRSAARETLEQTQGSKRKRRGTLLRDELETEEVKRAVR